VLLHKQIFIYCKKNHLEGLRVQRKLVPIAGGALTIASACISISNGFIFFVLSTISGPHFGGGIFLAR